MSAPRVSFYILSSTTAETRLGYTCRLIEKVYKLKNRVHAHVTDPAMARSLDDLLWTFRQGSFVPHELLPVGSTPAAPVTIGAADGADPAEPPAADLLINLAPEVPAFFQRYARIAEVIDDSPGCREAGRVRHRFYRSQGLEPETHEVT
jgi:DNA polymerase-3 subunit chi